MKLHAYLALALCVGAVLGDAPPATCNCANQNTASTIDMLKKALSEKTGLMAKWDGICKKELEETNKWIKTIESNSADNEADRVAREADKGKLAGALESRVAGLKEFIAQLKEILTKMKDHISRTNQIYGTKYDANLQDQTAASLALHDLSLDFAAPHNVKLNPIQQVADFDVAAPAAAAAAAPAAAAEPAAAKPAKPAAATEGEGAAAALMFLEQRVHAKAAACSGTGCQNAYHKAFALYKLGYAHNTQNKKNFEAERVTLGMFRKKTREMLDKKTAKVAALEKQLSDLKAAMASPDGNLAELFKDVSEHKTVFESSYKDFQTSSASGKEAMTALVAAIEAKDAANQQENAKEAPEPAAGSGVAESAPTAAPAAAAASPAATGTAGKAATGAKATAAADDADLTQILNKPMDAKATGTTL